MGIGVPGPVRSDGVVNGCVNLGWGVINVAEELGAQTGLKVKSEMMRTLQVLAKCGRAVERK